MLNTPWQMILVALAGWISFLKYQLTSYPTAQSKNGIPRVPTGAVIPHDLPTFTTAPGE